MAKFEDYLPGGTNDPNAPTEEITQEIEDAQVQQEARQDDSTPPIDWEKRYKELEQFNSRQAQTLGDYRKIIDEHIVNSTPEVTPTESTSPSPISVDDLLDDPNKAVAQMVNSHPDVQEARKLKEQFEAQQRASAQAAFTEKHSDFEDIAGTPEFQNWVVGSSMRQKLAVEANNYDFDAADALFSLYKAEQGLTQVQEQQTVEQVTLVESSGEMTYEPPKYSRSEYINKLTRARQGDLEAEDWVKRNAAGYREALTSGNVRD